MDTNSIQKILSDPQFLKELEQAIDSGKDVDYGWNGENEVCSDVFKTSTAIKSVIELLKKYLVK